MVNVYLNFLFVFSFSSHRPAGSFDFAAVVSFDRYPACFLRHKTPIVLGYITSRQIVHAAFICRGRPGHRTRNPALKPERKNFVSYFAPAGAVLIKFASFTVLFKKAYAVSTWNVF